MISNRPVRDWMYPPNKFLLAWLRRTVGWLVKRLPDFHVVLNGKRIAVLAVRDGASSRKRIYTIRPDFNHLYCPHCDGSIPTHDVLLALRPLPDGCSQLIFAEDLDGNPFLVNERDYNPVHMRIPEGKEYPNLEYLPVFGEDASMCLKTGGKGCP